MAEPAHDKKLRTALDRVLLDGYADRAILGVDGVTLGNQGAVPEASGRRSASCSFSPFSSAIVRTETLDDLPRKNAASATARAATRLPSQAIATWSI